MTDDCYYTYLRSKECSAVRHNLAAKNSLAVKSFVKQPSSPKGVSPFFSNQTAFSDGEESEEEDDIMEPDVGIEKEEIDRTEKGKSPAADGRQAWFKQPKHMPYWLYLFFIEKVGPLIFERKGKYLSRPESFSDRSAIYEVVRGRQEDENKSNATQSTLDSYMMKTYTSFGNFSDPEKYAGFVPSESFLTQMMNRVIEQEEPDANQHTSCISPDQIAIDDSHKINKHIAKIDGVPVFNALWTFMDSRITAHEERNGPLKGVSESIKRYGYSPPQIAFSDDPLKDKGLLHEHFPTLAEKLTPMSAAHGYSALVLPDSASITFIGSAALVNSALLTILAPLEDSSAANICVSVDAEWNISRTEGVSILQVTSHAKSDLIFIIPVYRFKTLPTALSRLLTSKRVFKIGSNIKGDITRLRKQFPAISDQSQTDLIDLKDFCITRGLVTRKEPGSLDILCKKLLNCYLEKPDYLRRHDDWETGDLSPALLNYAALDVYCSRLIFEKASEYSQFQRPSITSPPGTAVTLLLQDGGSAIAHGRIAAKQPNKLGELRNLAPGGTVPFSIVTPVSSLIFFRSNSLREVPETALTAHSSISALLNHDIARDRDLTPLAPDNSINSTLQIQEQDEDGDTDGIPDAFLDLDMRRGSHEDDEEVALSMLEAHSSVLSDTQQGKQNQPNDDFLSPESQAFSYDDWVNGDLYERTTEQFGICKFPDSLRLKLGMDSFNENSPILNASDDWPRRRQGLALPVIPPTTPEARRFFFSEIAKYVAAASTENKQQINIVAFSQDWNKSADGKSRFYITPEVLIAYAKTWEKNTNIKASTDLISDALDVISRTSQIFAAANEPFPKYLTALPLSDQPREGLLEDITDAVESSTIPASISTSLAVSRPAINMPSIPTGPSSSESPQPLLSDMFNNRTLESSLSIDAAEPTNEHPLPAQYLTPSTSTDSINTSALSQLATKLNSPVPSLPTARVSRQQ
ncbi:hypothetical protein HYPSUDRAFT_202494 [Hypholoma sublateritium FD-334 SS-4]|uniref:3'-5' exonuclease n=1 Tax=Hypholoma sublateritium (strain FD-334 SS-4) TaxID=945553 RepID=A0A0D2L530_HYPSF|nr:hypothetical protein HYPSUDRAFT_202494 [Hypholoma sublateritium FD-334 SS-4]